MRNRDDLEKENTVWKQLFSIKTFGSQTWTWNSSQQSRVCDVEMSDLKGACGVTRWEGESNKSVYERCGMGPCAHGVKCGVVEWVKRNTLRWFDHVE